MIRILQVVAYQPVGGVGTFLTGLKENLNNQEFKIDFLESTKSTSGDFNQKINDGSSNLHILPELKLKNVGKYFSEVKIFYKKNATNYDIVHVHAPNLAFLHFYYARKYGISVRIMHAHSTKYSTNTIKAKINRLLIFLGRKLATDFWGSSNNSVDFMFRNEDMKVVIPNGVDLNKFKFSISRRKKIREIYGIREDDFLVGCIGNLLAAKNYIFLLNVFEKIKKNQNIKLMIVGSGEQKEKLEKFIDSKELTNVILVERTKSPELFYSAFDLFVLCSKFEGFGYTALEAQASGLNCLFSTGIPKEVDILEENKYIGITNQDKDKWASVIVKESNFVVAESISSNRKRRFERISDSRYSITNSIRMIGNEYTRLMRDRS
ncbi:hypothetical protein LCW_02420 [Latilactobacillus curvatus]|uniref:glycosyltransferase n=1 Tax=Latilactobacillus curvatus TaxID=28038 RepID=UPI00084A1B3E|nr:glycosyltransferase [Latilactobacillus curvatus]AOO74998.1 hypothetical protein LCW_02420 [Latilactobacillus curvatus]